MPWVLLVVSAVLEAVWASALGASRGLSRPVPTALFVVAITLSMVGLARAARSIPMSTAYAVWTGLGAALTVAWAMALAGEPASVAKMLLIAGIVGSVIGLKLVGHPQPPRPRGADGGGLVGEDASS